MAIHTYPEFLVSLPKEEKEKLMKQYISWKKWEISELMVKHYEKKLEELIKKDESSSPLSWFQFKWDKAKRLGERVAIRKFIKDLRP